MIKNGTDSAEVSQSVKGDLLFMGGNRVTLVIGSVVVRLEVVCGREPPTMLAPSNIFSGNTSVEPRSMTSYYF
jgi:hypothetical protein